MTKRAHQQIATAEQEIDKLNVQGTAKAEFLRVRASLKISDNDLKGAEADLPEARKLDPDNVNIKLQYANLLWKEGRKDESSKIYNDVLAGDPNNRYALEAMGYLYREDNNPKIGGRIFQSPGQGLSRRLHPISGSGRPLHADEGFERADTELSAGVQDSAGESGHHRQRRQRGDRGAADQARRRVGESRQG